MRMCNSATIASNLASRMGRLRRHGLRAAARVPALAVLLVLGGASQSYAGAAGTSPSVPSPPQVRVLDRLPWRDHGVWLAGDIHTHNMADSDRARRMLAAAERTGLDFVASTEHAERAFSIEAIQGLARLRRESPGLIVLAGIEWNLPAGDHASVVVAPARDEWSTLKRFAKRFDRAVIRDWTDVKPGDPGFESALQLTERALGWLRETPAIPAAVYLNHPSKRDPLPFDAMARLLAAGLSGMAAAPGHQNTADPSTLPSIDRYDPMSAQVGGILDRLLAAGHGPGLAAGSDFHVKTTSYLPGVFSRTWVHAPERSGAGVVRGLCEGATVTVLGGVVRRADTRTFGADPSVAAGIGETLSAPPGHRVTYRVIADVPELDFEERPNSLDRVEIISDCLGQTQVVHVFEHVGTGRIELDYLLPESATSRAGRCFLRTRGRHLVGGAGHDRANADYLFYTGATHLEIR